ncbi:RNA polymerase sigma factor, TIGR02999 family [Solimonas aquatica]|uniref:RNA polymerase sigma factor, TIGR02999 family n=1 Tax=Solimonas aquatica TaxID=489703 RepID=A0A1H9FRZ6_9GAMM|nr:ECF-type sigma factor [Solimonas aquatica]SEQ40218.1 RNA polymerase sigma factor, TIGR02999 family [Solimonas aquatica]
MTEITQLLDELRAGDENARNELFSAIYPTLQQIARQRLGLQQHTLLDAPALVHEAYLRLTQRAGLPPSNRASFFAYASSVMRNVIIDYVRQRQADKRGGGVTELTLTTAEPEAPLANADIESLNSALEALARIDARAHGIVEMRFFGGLTIEEIAEVQQLSVATVKRDWLKARGFLLHTLEGAG